ncbi:MAG: NAD+ synthase [Syntrophomonadaceae bacterium]|nr:NAD+ synthase [Syntrophomonadaceae bacterium]
MNPTVGDFVGNLAMLQRCLEESRHLAPDLVVFPELVVTGYPPRDLLERDEFIERSRRAVREIANLSRRVPDTGILFGAPLPAEASAGKGLYNSAVLVANGEVRAERHKSLLPTYDVFDEARYFDPAPRIEVVPFKGETLGISICEDAWNHPDFWPRRRMYALDPIEVLARQGASLMINISASPFTAGKERIRYRLISQHAQRHRLPFIYVNQVGGNDELVFDGRSMALDAQGRPLVTCPGFREHLACVDTGRPGQEGEYSPQEPVASVHDALVLGIRDYVRKCGFTRVLVGLSGGIDSAVTCCLACAAVGAANVLAVGMPGPYSSAGSVGDARELAGRLGIRFEVVPIAEPFASYLQVLAPLLKGTVPDVTEENLQARIRGTILMALSNKFGYLLLSTGNKSEMAVGYCTLYGDMSGGLSVLADVPKTMVYALARFINRGAEVIPPAILEKPPSAELKPGQLDQDTLPPYPELDRILELYVEEGLAPEAIVARGFPRSTVQWVVRAVHSSEYKRRQAAPGLKVTSKAFGVGRRMPVAAVHDVP